MQKTSNQVSNRVEEINNESMKQIRAELVRNNTSRSFDFTNANLVWVESGACYNNLLFNAGTTAFHAGTQVTNNMIDNNTNDKIRCIFFLPEISF